MSTKKKPASKSADGKSAADKGPQPLLKLKFEKFPDKPVAVYFDVTKRLFRATFGFSEHEATSVGMLEGKIKAAIHKGVTPSPVWVPMISMGINIHHGRTGYKQALDLNFDVDIDREYFCIGKGGKLMSCGWEVHERSRNKDAREASGALAQMKPRALNAPIFKRSSSSFDGGTGVDTLIPYTDDLWRDLGEHVRELRAQAAGMIGHVVAGKLDVFTNFIFDFEASTRPAPKPAPKPAAKKAAPKSALLPFHEAAKKPIITGKLGKDVLPNADFKLLDLVIDLPPGPVPAELLEAAGFPAGSTAKKYELGDFMVDIAKQPGDPATKVGDPKHVPRAEMQKLIRDRINGQRGTKPQEVKKASPKKKAKAKKHNGDTTAREHLVVKYQGKQLTLGHGPLGNYLVEALRKTYPEIHSAFCLKDNQVQILARGVGDPFTITAADFERLINKPETLRSQRGVIGTPSPEWRIAALKLHELVDAMEPEHPPLVIPGLILLAAGFPESASADMHSPDEIIVRVPKKAPQFLSLAQFEERIRQRITAEAQEKEQASA